MDGFMPMKRCPNCNTELSSDTTSFCPHCGENLETTKTSPSPASTTEDDLDFVVTEAHEDTREFVGGMKPDRTEDELGVQSTANLLEQEAKDSPDTLHDMPATKAADNTPIGDTTPPPPTVDSAPSSSLVVGDSPTDRVPADTTGANMVTKLSKEEIKSIKEKMYGRPSKYLSNEEKLDLLKSIDKPVTSDDEPPSEDDQTAFGNVPIVPPKKAGTLKEVPEESDGQPKPKMAKRALGIAFFVRNFIQIKGEQDLHEYDELVINDRCYVLRKKTFSSKILTAVLAPLAALLIFWIGAYFTTNTSTGSGRIVGVVLDQANQPYLQGAIVRLPGLGKAYKTNSQGLFKTDLIETGSHKVEYVVNGVVTGSDYATIIANEITTVTLTPTALSGPTQADTGPLETQSAAEPESPEAKEPPLVTQAPAQKEPIQKPRKAKPKTTAQSKYARLRLAASVTGARLAIDGSVVGAGNLTYSKLKPGKHSYTVSSDGYQSKSGTIDLKAGKTSELKVTLEPLAAVQKQETFKEKDYYYSGVNALKEEKYETAIADLTEAIKIKPNYPAAYLSRAEAYKKTRDKVSACQDYVRAAEQYRFNGEYNRAITAYNRAADINPKSVPAHLGRASVYLTKGEEIAAIADYETVIRLDRRNFQAYYGLGEARFNQGYYKKAIKHFKDAKALDAKNPQVYQFLMLSYLAADDVNKVRKTYDKFKKIASEEDLNRMQSDKRFSAVLRVIKE